MTRLAASLLVLLALPVHAAPRQTVTISVSEALTGAPFFLGIERGHFARFGLDVRIERESTTATLALVNLGRLDFSFSGLRPAVFEVALRGGRLRIVAGGAAIPTTCSAIVVMASAAYAARHPRIGPADLRGARIGLNSDLDGSGSHYIIALTLEAGGLGPRDVTFLRLPFSAMPDALARGTIDAAVITEPYSTAVLERRVGVIVARARDIVPGHPVTVSVIGPSLQRSPGTASRLLAGYLLGVRDYMAADAKRDPETLRILSRYLRQPEDVIRKSCWQPIRRDGQINVAAHDRLQRWWTEQGLLSQPVDLARVVDTRYLRDAWRLLEESGVSVR